MEFQKLCLCLTIVQLREIQFHRACLKKIIFPLLYK